MRIFRHFADLPADARGGAVAIGNFDGMHLGHQAVIREAGKIARDHCCPWAVLTFEPHPRGVFSPELDPFRLTPFRAKARHIEALGVDVLVVAHFDLEFSMLAAEEFVDRVLVAGLGVRHVVCGYDFVFGHKRKGDCQLLLQKGAERGFGFTSLTPVVDAGGAVYSATRVRSALMAGDPRAAAAILGRFFEIEGRVQEGEKRGRRIGFPTANIHLGEYLRPAHGVYAVRATIDEGGPEIWFDGVANLGRRPTFGEGAVVLEAYLFDFQGDLYGKHLRVALVDFLRPERKFRGVDELKAQIATDSERARRILAGA